MKRNRTWIIIDVTCWSCVAEQCHQVDISCETSNQLKYFVFAPGVKASNLTNNLFLAKESVGCPVCSNDITFTYKVSSTSELYPCLFQNMTLNCLGANQCSLSVRYFLYFLISGIYYISSSALCKDVYCCNMVNSCCELACML